LLLKSQYTFVREIAVVLVLCEENCSDLKEKEKKKKEKKKKINTIK